MFVLGHYWLPLATIDLVNDKREIKFFEDFLAVIYPLQLTADLKLYMSIFFLIGNHWLPVATIDLVGDNREFEV